MIANVATAATMRFLGERRGLFGVAAASGKGSAKAGVDPVGLDSFGTTEAGGMGEVGET